MSAPQYLTSTDADVVAAVKANHDAWPAFRDEATAWANERGSDSAFWDPWSGRVVGLRGIPEGFGQWTKPNHRGLSRPFANNDAERTAMRAIRLIVVPVPGLPEMVDSPGPDFSTYLMPSQPFVQDGAAWVGYGHPPVPETEFGEQWHECLASAYFAAREAHVGVAS